jgi:hypothetical protein
MKARQASSSFFEKKEPKKLLPIWARRGHSRVPGEQSFFASFFSKKEDSCFLPVPSPP